MVVEDIINNMMSRFSSYGQSKSITVEVKFGKISYMVRAIIHRGIYIGIDQ